MDLGKVKDREALKPSREPYWQRLRPGCFIGYRPSARGGAGTWIARAYDEQARAYKLKALGDFGSEPSRDRFALAKVEAESFATRIEGGGESKIETVEQACRRYGQNRPDAEARFRRYVYSDPIAKLKLAKLRRHHLIDWRERLATTPAQVSRRKEGERITRQRAPSSINRDMTPLRAALNKVLAPGNPGTEAAWQEALKPIENADRQRTLYLDRKQRQNLLAALTAEAAPFFRAMCLLPLRPGAVAGLTAGDYDKRTSLLTIGKDKNGKPRQVVLPAAAAKLFAEQAKGKLPGAPLFMRANGTAWDKNSWKVPIADAVTAAKLPAGVTAYTLRHSVITDLARGGLPLLTIAQISDTSVEMIERHYGQWSNSAATEALAGLAL
ncbi:tyrosine-type recombinase/integrase [Sphingomonas sp. CJ99]